MAWPSFTSATELPFGLRAVGSRRSESCDTTSITGPRDDAVGFVYRQQQLFDGIGPFFGRMRLPAVIYFLNSNSPEFTASRCCETRVIRTRNDQPGRIRRTCECKACGKRADILELVLRGTTA